MGAKRAAVVPCREHVLMDYGASMRDIEEVDEPMKITPQGGGGGFLTRLIVTVVIVAAIVLVTCFFAVRTEGMRALIEEHLEKLTGVEVNVGRSTIGVPYVLVLENVVSKGFLQDEGGIKVREVRIGLGIRTRWHVQLHRPELNLRQTENGIWLW